MTRRGGWRAWGPVRGGSERALPDPPALAIAAAQIASEHRRGADSVRVTVAVTVDARDVADALATAWDAFTGAAADDLNGWDVPLPRPRFSPGRLSRRPRPQPRYRSGGPESQGITSKHLPRGQGKFPTG